ncbi:MAG: response regulator MprA [Candidatus Nomurabacteria bacterium]|nr:response regulator MprA [Candidatus Nomurabacteria bacterium]
MVLVNKISKYYVIFILAIGAALTGLLFLYFRPVVHGAVLRTPTIDIPITVADTAQSREQGLSGTASLPSNTGMLFVFDASGKYGFWMKDMQYPLDFVWIDENFTIVDITSNVAANTYPTVFYPAQPIRYMLEVNANFSTAHSLAIGQTVQLIKK